MAIKPLSESGCINECDARQSCSAVSAAAHEDPIGTASSHDRYLFVEVPLPWDYQAAQSRHFPQGLNELLGAAKENAPPIRLISFVSDVHASPEGFRRILYFHKPAAPFAKYGRKEYVVPEGELIALAEELIYRPDGADRFAAYARDAGAARDLFVCTHGSHDVCCGRFGYPIYKRLEDDYASSSSGTLRIWRVSHIGGHRFAPTVIDLPEGRYWAHLEPEDLPALVHRQGSFAEIARRYRGWGGLGKAEQLVEREIFKDEGWRWIDYEKQGAVLQQDGDSVRVRIDYRSADGAVSGAYEGTVVPVGSVSVGGCGNEFKDQAQYQVQHVIKLQSIAGQESGGRYA